MTDYSELKRMAESATGGDWEYRLGMVRTLPDADGYVPIAVSPNAPKSWRVQRDANMAFIASAKPSTIVALLDELDMLRVSHQSALDDCKARWTERDQLKAENEMMRLALKSAEDAMWKAESNMDNEAADIRDLLAVMGQGEQA